MGDIDNLIYMPKQPKDLIFNPSMGISNSPLSENAYSQCIDNDSAKGIAKVNYETDLQSGVTNTAYTWTLQGVTDIETSSATSWVDGVAVQFTTTGTLPTGVSLATTYYLKDNSGVAPNYWEVYATYDNAKNGTSQINMSGGSGTHTVTPIQMTNIVKFINNRAIDGEGNFWQFVTDGDWELLTKGSGSGVGFEEYDGKAYLFRGGSNIDQFTIATDTLNAGWQSSSGGVSLIGQDDTMYIGRGNLVRSWDGTTFTASALDLPEGESINCIGEIGRFLALGTNQNKIYLWDRVSTTFELPISTVGAPQMLIPANNLLYFVNDSGDIYVTNGSSASLVKEFPRHILDKDFPSFVLNANAWRVEDREIYIGYGSSTTTSPMGVYQYSLEDGDFKLAYIISTGAKGGSGADRTRIDAIQSGIYGTFLIGWTQAGTTYGVDRTSITKRYTGYKAIVYSPFYKVGTKYNPKAYKHTEISLSEKLKTGQGVRVSYRTDLSGSWTTIGTFDTVDKISDVLDKTIHNLEYVQIRAELTTNQDTYTPNLAEIRLYE